MTSPSGTGENQAPQTLKILVKGFSGFEMRLLDGVVKLSQRRNPVLVLATEDGTPAVDVVMIDGKDAQAFAWASEHAEWLKRQPVIWVDSSGAIPPGHTDLKRPLQWTNLPTLLARAMDDASYGGAEAEIDFDLPAPARHAAPRPEHGAPANVPAANDLSAQQISAARPAPAQEVAGASIPVLVVDDSAAVRSHLNSVLTSYGYKVTAAESGEAGVMEVGRQHFECVLMDVLMPGIDGYDACRRIKSMRRDGRAVPPVVMLTSKSSPFDKIRGKMAGCDAYLTKPVQKSHLMEVLALHTHKNA